MPSDTRSLLHEQMKRVLTIFEETTGQTGRNVFRAAMKNDHHFWKRYWSEAGGWSVATHDRILLWMSERWPEGVEWPVGVPRPTSSSPIAAE